MTPRLRDILRDVFLLALLVAGLLFVMWLAE